ncbi:helix-turn-helix domain-containing protein [Thiopseudomonas alkaliphila]|uniref:helix-turn-helix domain-containing protein n=2 Tax=Thiopseudomonas alkaliphila TaxID=1697053 RepID=UPI003307194C
MKWSYKRTIDATIVQNKHHALKAGNNNWRYVVLKCNLSTLMGKERLTIAEVIRRTGLTRNAVTTLYDERAKRIDLNTIARLCELFECTVDDLFEYIPNAER